MALIARMLTATVILGFFTATPRADPGEVWKTATCSCCTAWIDHMAQHGFVLKATDLATGALARFKHKSGVPPLVASCHTAKIGGYFIEGHVPASDVRRLLSEKPDAVGLAVAGMPIGSPGMESGDIKEPFDVLLMKRDGSTEVFSKHGANSSSTTPRRPD